MGLLVLSRKKDESIVINDDIIITIVDIRGDKCRIGIEAPKDVPVHRLEVYNAIHREKAVEKAVDNAAAGTESFSVITEVVGRTKRWEDAVWPPDSLDTTETKE